MALLNISNLFKNRSYERLPIKADLQSNQTARMRRWLLVAAGICANLIVLWIFVRLASDKGSYSPLDNYQPLNNLPLIRNERRSPSSSQHSAIFSSLYSNSFAMGAAVLGHSIRQADINASLILLYLDNHVSSQALCITKAAGWENHAVPVLPPPQNGKDIHRRFADQYTKLRIWSLGDELGIDSAVYLNADTLVRRNFDELFDMPWVFGATPDVYKDDRGFAVSFNAGVFAFKPSRRTFADMEEIAYSGKADYSLKQAEQVFLNSYFGAKMVRLPYAYNANLVIKKRSSEMWDELKDTMKVVHYTMVKPFLDNSVPNDRLMTPEQVRGVNDVAHGESGGFYSEEVGWWREAFEDLMQEKGAIIEACFS